MRVMRFEDGDEQFLGCAWIGSAFQNNQLSLLHPGSGRHGGFFDEAEVRLMMFGEWSGDAHTYEIRVRQAREVIGGAESVLERALDLGLGDAEDVGSARF